MASAQGRVRGQRWKLHSSALESHPQTTAKDATLVTCSLSWEKDVAQNRVAAGTDLQQAVKVAIVMKHAPAAYRDLLKVVPLANPETYQALRAYVREWTLAQRNLRRSGATHDSRHVSADGHRASEGHQGER